MTAEMVSSVINDLVDFTLEKSGNDFRQKNAKHVKYHHRHGKHCRHKLKARGLAPDVNVLNSSTHPSSTVVYEKSPCVKRHHHHHHCHSNASVTHVVTDSRTNGDSFLEDAGRAKASVVAQSLVNTTPTRELNTWRSTLDEDVMHARIWNMVYNLPAERSEETVSVGGGMSVGGGSLFRCHPNHIFAPITSPDAYSIASNSLESFKSSTSNFGTSSPREANCDAKMSGLLPSSDRASSTYTPMSTSSLPDDVAPTVLPSRSPSPRSASAKSGREHEAKENINYSTANDDNECGRDLDEDPMRSLTSFRRHTSDDHMMISSALPRLPPLVSNSSTTVDTSRKQKRKKSTRTSSAKKSTTSSTLSGGRRSGGRGESCSSSRSGGVCSHRHKTNRPLSLTASSHSISSMTSSSKKASSPPSVIITADCVTPSRAQIPSDNIRVVRKRCRAIGASSSKEADENRYASPPFGGISINLDVVVRDETTRESRIHPMHFMVDCPRFKVERVFVNGKAFH